MGLQHIGTAILQYLDGPSPPTAALGLLVIIIII